MAQADFTLDIWYFAGLSSDVRTGQMIRRVIAGQPINLGRNETGRVFATSDICPHRAAPLSKGCLKDGTVECPYHGWRFGIEDGACKEIPALTAEQNIDTQKIKLRLYHLREEGQLIWIYIPSNPKETKAPTIDPPQFPFANRKPAIQDAVTLNCYIDHAVIGLMDPAHGPYVHRQWWWRSERSMHEKSKAFVPHERGFTMAAHSPSSNSLAYKLLGGKPVTEITFQLPSLRSEEIKVGRKTVLSFTALTPIDENRTEIRQVFFSNHLMFNLLRPIIKILAAKFLRQDSDMVDLQQMGLKHNPSLMLIDDADTQAKWYFALKKEWANSRADKRAFKNPVKAKTLKWRS